MKLTINKPINLEETFPSNWDLHKHVDTSFFCEYGFYKHTLTHHKYLEDKFKEKFGEECFDKKYYECNKLSLTQYLESLLTQSFSSLMPLRQKFGLEYNSLVSITNDVTLCVHNKGIKGSIYKRSNIDTHSALYDYSPTISFVKSFYNNSIKDKVIIEIGSGIQGIRALSYLESLGAKVYAIDGISPKEEFLDRSRVKYIRARWEDISEFFEKESVDVIFTNFMHPSPHGGGRFNNYNSSAEWYQRMNEFEEHISQAMHKILRPYGLYINKMLGIDYVNEYISSGKNFSNFSNFSLPIESYGKSNDFVEFRMGDEPKEFRTVWDLPEECLKNYPLKAEDKEMYFGKELIIFQKKA